MEHCAWEREIGVVGGDRVNFLDCWSGKEVYIVKSCIKAAACVHFFFNFLVRLHSSATFI